MLTSQNIERKCSNSLAQSSCAVVINHTEFPRQNDIVLMANKTTLTDLEKQKILLEKNIPDDSFNFPSTTFGKQKRKFQISRLHNYKWLEYSQSIDKVFCKFCITFHKTKGGPGSSQSSAFHSNGFGTWNKASEKFDSHQKTKYHETAVIFAENFLKTIETNTNIATLVNKQRAAEIEKNRAILRSIIETIIFCGRQNISLRGDTDHGRIMEEDPDFNDGNFRCLLRSKMQSGDTSLLNHMTFGKSNALYTSPVTQNLLIELCGNDILRTIVSKINKAKYFSILVDETTDVSTKEQLSLSVRYVDSDSHEINEDFLGFTEVEDLSGESLTNTIIAQLSNLNLKNLRGQAYDGASNMSGKFAGVQKRIQELYPTCLYTYCASHKLNIVISDSCALPDIRNCIGTIKETQNFFSRSPKRTAILKNSILNGGDTEITKKRLTVLSETRWVDRHESLLTFSQLSTYIVSSLEYMEQNFDKESQVRSNILLKSLQNSSFLVALKSCEYILSLTISLSKAFQNPKADLPMCYEMITTLLDTLGSIKENCCEEFKIIFSKVEQIASFCDIELCMPRFTKQRRLMCSNVSCDNVEEYFRIAIFTPFLEHTIESLQGRFDKHQSSINHLCILLPKYAVTIKDSSNIMKLKEFYFEDLETTDETLAAEFKLWVQKWRNIEKEMWPDSLTKLLQECDSLFYPSIHTLLLILCTLPVTTATSERSFSCLRRLKTYLRNFMGNDRLNGLALLNVHREIECNIEQVLTDFALQKNHRIVLI